jgi:hypothetical protein
MPLSSGTSTCTKDENPNRGWGFLVEAPGIEPDLGQQPSTMEHRSSTIGTDGDPANVSDRAPKCSIVPGDVTISSEAYDLTGVVETALAKALVLAAEAKRWDVVTQIADELRRRSGSRTSPLTSARRKRSSRV